MQLNNYATGVLKTQIERLSDLNVPERAHILSDSKSARIVDAYTALDHLHLEILLREADILLESTDDIATISTGLCNLMQNALASSPQPDHQTA